MPSGEASANRITIGREDQPPAFGDRRQPVLQQDERDGAPKRAEEMMHPAQHRHQQGIAGVLPAQIVGVGALAA